jgi:hypothetical protein
VRVKALHCSILSLSSSSDLMWIWIRNPACNYGMRLLRRWNLTILSDKLVSKKYSIFYRKKICNSPDKIDSPVSSSGSLQELLRMNVPPEVTNLHKENETEKKKVTVVPHNVLTGDLARRHFI